MNTRTTYSDLTGHASAQVERALHLLGNADRPAVVDTPGWAGTSVPADDAAAAHRDLTSALVHLGRALLEPLGDRERARSRNRGAGHAADAALLASLATWAQPRDWTEPLPDPDTPAGCLTFAARLARAAADLWNTHHGDLGRPRSPEASRMRHPSMLGAATREWRALVAAAACVADRLESLQATRAAGGTSTPAAARSQATFPTPATVHGSALASGSDVPCERVELTVARPSAQPSADPILAIQDRVDHLRRMSWILAESGTAPIPILANTAAIGVLLASATAQTTRLALDQAAQPATGLDLPATLMRAEAAELASQRWSDVSRLVGDLRSAHPSTTAIQVERVDLARLLAQVTRRARNGGSQEIADGLWAALQAYTDVAHHLGEALRAASIRGEVYVRGRALPAHVLPRSSDLLEAKLADRPVTIPESMLRPVESAYAALRGGSAPERRRPRRRPRGDDHSPAA